MSNGKEIKERRKHERYKVKDGIVAAPYASSTRFAKILDISMGGLTVKYFDERKWDKKKLVIDVVMVDGDFSLDKVPITIASDMDKGTETPYCYLPERRCCLQFADLTEQQFTRLNDFFQEQALLER
jgi:hypothetical protein